MTDPSTLKSEFTRPVPLILLAAAVLGWIIVISLLFSRNELRSDMESRLKAAEADRLVIVDELDKQVATSGSLEELLASLEKAQGELILTEEQRATVLQDLESRQQDLASVTQQEAKMSARLKAVAAEIAPIDERLANQSQLVDDAEKKTIARTDELAAVGQRLEQARAQEADLRKSVSQLSAEASDLADQASQAESRVQEVRDAEASLQQELDKAHEELATMEKQNSGLEEAVAQLSARRAQLAEDTSAAQSQRDALQEELTDLTQALSTRADELTQLEERIAGLQEQGAQATAANIVGLRVGQYEAVGITASFDSDGNFAMTPEGAEQMTGQYAVDGSKLTLTDVESPAEGYVFPMSCEISFEPTGFSLSALEGSEDGCAPLAGKTFAQK